MTLSYKVDPFGSGDKRAKVKVRITTDHSMSSYGQPVIVLPDGKALDLMSWVGCGYHIEVATAKERVATAKMFAAVGLAMGGRDGRPEGKETQP